MVGVEARAFVICTFENWVKILALTHFLLLCVNVFPALYRYVNICSILTEG